jgi:O-antigen/teichoic acid export membrane protein
VGGRHVATRADRAAARVATPVSTDPEASEVGAALGSGQANRRLSIVTIDQVLSSLSNVAALIWVAHALAPGDFGRFSMIVMIYTVAQVVSRSLISTTALVHPEEADNHARRIVASGVMTGLIVGVVCVLAGLLLHVGHNSFAGPVLALAVSLPLMMLQDVGRYLAIARQEPGRAVVLDSLWLALMIGSFVGLGMLDGATLTWLVLAWAGAGAIAGIWVFAQYGLPARGGLEWLREHWAFSWRSLVSGVTSSGTVLLMGALMTLFSSVLAVAAFRAATLLSAPSTAMQLAVTTSAAADIARERESERAVWHHVRRAITIAFVVGALNLVLLVFLPDIVGKALLGESWLLVKPLMLPVALKVLLMAGQSGLRAALIGQRRITTAMVTDIVSMGLICICMVTGAALGDVKGALWAMVVATVLSTGCWWVAMVWKGRDITPARAEPAIA